ncbi:hypothetical protein ACEWY4_005769 [Coilia grayii]|uniref:Protein kintoun n=1 Tax=Coilia grayii TaxID=363190 RepID=A0ABD1KJH9_9TELE
MEFGSKLEEMNLTSDEIGRLSKAMKDETFRKLLHEYADEISNPENRKRYEEDIKLLEQERGMDVQFVHPKPFRALKTSDGRQKCFINICSNELIKTPECAACTGEGGRRGLNWSLPYSLAPGRPDVDSNGNKCMIYDVVFNPDTLHMASKNARFMELVDSTAFDGIQESFKVKLDRKNTRVLKTKYKGVPHASVIRRQTPGVPTKQKTTDKNDPLAFPYPYDIEASTVSNGVKKSLANDQSKLSTHTEAVQTLDERPTEPKYTIKYRSVVDLQDYRCSRDSVPSPRPREIVIAIDLPLLRCAADAELDVSEKQVVLRSSRPAYLLELDLSYPVDENKGHAKFNKQKKQLVVTLPVLPLKEPPPAAESPVFVTADDPEEEQLNGPNTEEAPEEITTAEDGSQACQHNSDEADAELSGLYVQCADCATDSDCGTVTEPRFNKQEWYGSSLDVQQCTFSPPDLTITESFTVDTEQECVDELGSTNEEVDTVTDATLTSLLDHTLEKIQNNVTVQGEAHNAECTDEAAMNVEEEGSQVDSSVAPQESPNMADSQTLYDHVNDSTSQEKAPGTYEDTVDKSDSSSGSNSTETVTNSKNKKTVQFSKSVSVAEEVDEDDLPNEQSGGDTRRKQPTVVLRELNPEDGTEVIISDHTTASAFVFQNSLLYELD